MKPHGRKQRTHLKVHDKGQHKIRGQQVIAKGSNTKKKIVVQSGRTGA